SVASTGLHEDEYDHDYGYTEPECEKIQDFPGIIEKGTPKEGEPNYNAGNTAPANSPLAFTPTGSSGRRGQKRRLDGGESSGESSGEPSGSSDYREDGKGKRPRRREKSPKLKVESCKFACPFHKQK